MARQTLKSLSPLCVWRSLIKGSSTMASDFYFSSPTICYFRKICNKQKFRGEKSPTKPKLLSLFGFHDNLLKNSTKRAV